MTTMPVTIHTDPHEFRVQASRAAGVFRRNEDCAPLPAYTGAVKASVPCGVVECDGGRCHWPLTDGAPWTYCGAPKRAGSFYCVPHHKRAYKLPASPEQQEKMAGMRAAKRSAKIGGEIEMLLRTVTWDGVATSDAREFL